MSETDVSPQGGSPAGAQPAGAPSPGGPSAGTPSAGPRPAGSPAAGSQTARGLVYAGGAYLIWGFLPIYFIALAPTGPFEIVAWRVVFSLAFCAIATAVTRAWRPLLGILRRPRIVLIMGAAGALIYVNWQTYVYATTSGQVVQAALGYFINPIFTVLLGVIVLRERLRVVQWVAIAISVIAVIVITVGYGQFPWIALLLAASFGLYGLVKKQVGHQVDALSGLTLETAWLTPVAIVQLIVVGAVSGITFGHVSAWNTIGLVAAGVITAVPLLFFAAASRRLPLIVMGFIQYFTPILQLIVGVVLLREPMSTERWIGFGLVWAALAILTIDMVLAVRRERRAGRTAAAAHDAAPAGEPADAGDVAAPGGSAVPGDAEVADGAAVSREADATEAAASDPLPE